MHLLTTTSANLDEMAEPIDLGQPPGDIVVLSFADSDLSGLMAAWALERNTLPSVRLAHLRDLRHPMSVDLWIERVGRLAKVVVVRLLGGLEWWRYGIEQLSCVARQNNIALAVLPGEDQDDPRLAEFSTIPQAELDELLQYFRDGGRENLRGLLRRLARHAGVSLEAPAPRPVPALAGYIRGQGAVDLEYLVAHLVAGAPVVPIVFYRAQLLAADTAPIDALCEALAARGLAPATLFVTSLKDNKAAQFMRAALERLNPAVVITTTAFAVGSDPDDAMPLEAPGVPVLQAVIATTKQSAWRDSARGLGASDLAMNVVLPELDGRVLSGAISFKQPISSPDGLAFTALANCPEPDGIAMVADRVAALVRLQRTPRNKRRVAVVMPDYPGLEGRTGYAVGLDVPASMLALLVDLAAAGYVVSGAPQSARALLDAVEGGSAEADLPIDIYTKLLAREPREATERIIAAWGNPGDDPDVRNFAFQFRARAFGEIILAIAPDRGGKADRRADYHDAALPPRHALIAFGLWLRHVARVDALVHMGAHGTLEWLPGKAVALTPACFPEMVVGWLPVFYPFIVSNPGEAAQAKRRIAAVTIGHLPPRLTAAGLCGEARELERLADEYAQADGLDRRRRERLAQLIIAAAQRSGLAREAGVTSATGPDEALRRIDAWLCDLKDLAIKDGLHVYGRPNVQSDDPLAAASAGAERSALIAALDGKRVKPGPAGAPSRGRRDVLPTGRNLFTADPRMLPSPTAMDLGRLAADEVIRGYLQTHGEMPRTLVVDLWGSATLRTGGEEIAQGLAFMGCQPIWDHVTGRITGIEVLPTATIGRARIDVTWRVSGLFRDLFPAQIALIDAAVLAVAAREEDDEENPLAALRRQSNGRGRAALARIFSTAPGAYGAGIEYQLADNCDRAAIGAAYLAAASHGYGGVNGDGTALPGAFADRVASADLLVHAGDDPGRDLLEGEADVGFVGGFSAAAAALGRKVDLVMLDTTDPQRPCARPLALALARIVRSRAVNLRFIEGQMRHGPRGAAELVETVDRLVSFAEMTDAVGSELIDLLHEAYVADPHVHAFLLRENPAAARGIARRLEDARRRGCWHPRRNDVDAELAALMAEAAR
jgi:cobaltochelatase CobN